MQEKIIISKEFTFEASHILPLHPGKCSRLHGHSWVLIVSVIGERNLKTGFVMDYAELKRLVNPLIEKLDHSHLGHGEAFTRQDPAFRTSYIVNEREPTFGLNFYPSSENLVVAIADYLSPIFTKESNAKLYEITLKETCTSAATYRLT